MHTDINDELDAEALHFAAAGGDVDAVRALLEEGRDVNTFDSLGKTPLHYAAEHEHFAVAELLLRSGAEVNAHSETHISNTPLGEIAGSCSLRMATLLIDAGADPRITGWMQLTALHRASERKRGEGPMVYELLLRSANKLQTDA